MGADLKKTVTFVDRRTNDIIEETVMGDGALRFAYETLLGHCLSGLLFNTSGLSRLMGCYYDSKLSARSISALTSIPGCDAAEAEKDVSEYQSFNDFFTRRLKVGARNFDMSSAILSSPSDGRLLVYENLRGTDPVPVKGAQKTLNELCGETLEFDCAVAVVRLAPVDYHRFHFPCDCVQQTHARRFKGKYHSVNPVALAKFPDLYVDNTREITELESSVFGSFRMIDVGAFGVGSIIQTASAGEHRKGDEKGYFKFGGSTIILIFDNSRLKWDDDLLANSRKGYETIVRAGENLGAAR